MNIPTDLQPGDICLYFTPGNRVSEGIAFAEGVATMAGKVSHVEVYAGDRQSWASRDGIGVDLYPFRSDGLVTVRRPFGTFDEQRAAAEFAHLRHTPYGSLDNGDNLLQAGIDRGNGTMNCSHFASVLLEKAGVPQFDHDFDARYIVPADFLKSRASLRVYQA